MLTSWSSHSETDRSVEENISIPTEEAEFFLISSNASFWIRLFADSKSLTIEPTEPEDNCVVKVRSTSKSPLFMSSTMIAFVVSKSTVTVSFAAIPPSSERVATICPRTIILICKLLTSILSIEYCFR